jgi:hypothetical protein
MNDDEARPKPGRDLGRPLPFRPAARAVFDLSLEGMIWTRRSVLMAVLVGMPVVFAILYRVVLVSGAKVQPVTPNDLYAVVVAIYWIRNVLPLAALFYATALVADEVEGKTLTYLLTRPLTRASIFAGKFAAYLVTTVSLALPAAVLTFFALLGVVLKRPVIPGLMFLYGWELLANLPGYLPRLTLTAWLRSLVNHRPAQEGLAGLFQQVLPAQQAVPVLLVATIVFLLAGARIFSGREYVLEQ